MHPSRIIVLVLILSTLTLIILKATGVISWPWKWIFSPLWGSFALAVIAFLVWYVIILINS